MRYVHTNLIARDWQRVSAFYQNVLGCRPVPPKRDLSGQWVDQLTGVPGAHIVGEHLALPGYADNLPTLEIFSYEETMDGDKPIYRTGFAHLAFEVEDVHSVLQHVLQEGGGQLGEVVCAQYPGNVSATFVYATDPEGNILELQNWKHG